MGSTHKRRRNARQRTRLFERLEDRQVMSADPIGGLLGGSIQHHSLEDSPSLVHHAARDADFWIDSRSERDVETLVGDVEQTLASAHNSTGLTGVRNDYGFTGAGQTVAVIDSGIAWNHPALGSGLGANYRVVGGWDFTENDADPYDDGPWGSHGTHVAGIIGSEASGTSYDGVATGVDLVGLRVFDDAGEGYFNWVEDALRWVHQNRNAFENPITAVNLSLGTSWNSNSIPEWTTLEDEFAQLKADGIFIAVSAGNSFETYNEPGLSYPAASPHVVPVMSTMDNGSLSAFSQRHTRAIAAPGQYIVSTVPDYVGNNNGATDDFASFSGTSMAAPYVAGASVLLRQAMQFVGYANVTQDTIYDHMMATATNFFDAATNQAYKRLNLTNAFNSLMPSDEYGSTVATAHNLGALSGASEVSGLIGKLSDRDYFRFTAAATGTVTFTATTTHGLAPAWLATGGTVSGSDGETYTLDVVAGQSYTIGLSTSGGIGYYDLAIEAENPITYVDWGTISQTQSNNIANSGEQWYRVTAGRTGYFTAEAIFNVAGGDIDLSIYDSNVQLLSSSAANAVGERVDMLATTGTNYFVRVTGTNSDVDFRLTNLLTRSGATVDVGGTSGSDSFTLAVGATQHAVSVNGVTYEFNKSAVSTIDFAGGASADSITLTGSSGNDTATLRFASVELTGDGYGATGIDIENITVHGGGGAEDIAYLYDTAGNDSYTGWWNRAVMNGDGYWNDARGFDSTYAYASLGTDQARFYDTAGDDIYTAWWDRAVLSGAGYLNEAGGFDRTMAHASAGNDRAVFHDSAGDDIYGGWSDRALMYSSGYRNDAYNFDRTQAYASQGSDRAYFYDSAGDDQFVAESAYARMSGGAYNNYAEGFASAYAYATKGGVDRASLYDSAGNDQFTAAPTYGCLTGSGLYKYASGFDCVDAYATAGGVDSATLRDSSGNDQFVARPEYGRLSGSGFNNCAWSFNRVEGLATAGGTDVAYLYDSPGDDLLVTRPEYGRLSGNGFDNYAGRFDRTYAYSTAGGNDRSNFYDSLGNDQFVAYPDYTRMSGSGYYNYARGFQRTYAYATGSGIDEALLHASPAGTQWSSGIDFARLSGDRFYNYAKGFESLRAFAGDGSLLVNVQAVDAVFASVGA